MLVYFEGDSVLKKIVMESTNPIKKYAYNSLEHTIDNGVTYLLSDEGKIPLKIFGKHNLQNLAGAQWVCQLMGIDKEQFIEAISSFNGASKRLEKLAESKNRVLFKDFAHSPSKVLATVNAVKAQFPKRKLIACLELHTYSSLNATFLKDYVGTLQNADKAVVFYSPDAVAIKGLEKIDKEQILKAFKREDLIVFTDPLAFKHFIDNENFENSSLLLMSSGNYGGLNLDELALRFR